VSSRIRTEFPDFDDMETFESFLGEGSADVSWHNDMMPCIETANVLLWIDYKDHRKSNVFDPLDSSLPIENSYRRFFIVNPTTYEEESFQTADEVRAYLNYLKEKGQ